MKNRVLLLLYCIILFTSISVKMPTIIFANNDSKDVDLPLEFYHSDLKISKVFDIPNYKAASLRHVGIAFNGEFYLVVAGQHSSKFYKSFDGIDWEQMIIEVVEDGNKVTRNPGSPSKLIWDGNQFVLLCETNIWVSSDGHIWREIENKHPNYKKEYTYEDIIYSNGKYIIVAQDRDKHVYGYYFPGPNSIFIGEDLNHLQLANKVDMINSIAGERPLDQLVTNGTTYIASGNGTAISKDGLNWSGVQRGSSAFNMIWDGQYFLQTMTSAENSIDRTRDGSNWETVFSYKPASYNLETKRHNLDGIPLNLRVLGFNGKEYIAAGTRVDLFTINKTFNDLIFFQSFDGLEWKMITIENGDDDIENILPTDFGFILTGSNIWTIERTIPSAWAASTIQNSIDNELVPKQIQSYYQWNITREEFGELALKLYEKITAKQIEDIQLATNPFKDTTNPAIIKANQLGIISGKGNGLFVPNEAITREDIAVLFSRILRVTNIKVDAPHLDWLQSYSDLDQISNYALNSVQSLNQLGILTGKNDSKIAPKGKTTREEAIIMAWRMYSLLNRS